MRPVLAAPLVLIVRVAARRRLRAQWRAITVHRVAHFQQRMHAAKATLECLDTRLITLQLRAMGHAHVHRAATVLLAAPQRQRVACCVMQAQAALVAVVCSWLARAPPATTVHRVPRPTQVSLAPSEVCALAALQRQSHAVAAPVITAHSGVLRVPEYRAPQARTVLVAPPQRCHVPAVPASIVLRVARLPPDRAAR